MKRDFFNPIVFAILLAIISTGCVSPNNPELTIGGLVEGLTDSMELADGLGNTVIIDANGPFSFDAIYEAGDIYDVTVFNQPSAQTCSLDNGAGTFTTTAIIDVQVTCTNPPSIFEYTGDIQSFTVPAGVTAVTAKLWGGGGGSSLVAFTGGAGGFSKGDIDVTPGEELMVYVAGGGQSTLNVRGAAGGGGGSSIRRSSTRLIVAGGGGGSTGQQGGTGGGLSGVNGQNVAGCGGAEGGKGGTQTEPGAGGAGSRRTGASAIGSDGGQLGTGVFHAAGGWGDGLGGAGAYNSSDAGSGGGGGGYFGGGEGGGFCGGTPGGGGSGYIDGSGASNVITEIGQDAIPAAQNDPDYLPGIAEGGVREDLTGNGGNGLVVIQPK